MNDFPGGTGPAATETRTSAPAPAAPHAAATRTPEPLYGGRATRRVTVSDLAKAKARGEKWPMLTAYDALTAHVFDEAGIPVLLVGDSAGMVVFGHDTTIPVTLDELIPLTAAVVRGTSRALIVADLPFGSYQASPGAALAAGIRFLKEAGAHAVKLEGGRRVVPQAEELVAAGIPVMGHLGLTPQSVNVFGGYRVQGRGEDGEQLLQDAKALEAAGAFAVVLECVPAELAARVTGAVSIPTIGIGPARTATHRCWSGRTWPACPRGRPSSSSATRTWPACSAGPPSPSPRRSPAARSRPRSTPIADPAARPLRPPLALAAGASARPGPE